MTGHSHTMEDVAVVGLGLRFPGNATSPEELWNVLDRKESQWSEFPKDRLNIDGYYHPSGRRQGGISFRGGHFLKEDITAFDASFFAIPTEEANAVDPQQRVLLEVSYEALENAGIKKEDIDGGDGAVYVGSFVKDYEQICLRDPDWSPQYAATGNGIAIMANRISYVLNMHGPSMTIDTGCSGSLIAVHLAAQSLRTGETSLALAAGAGMILTPNTIMPMTALNFLSPDGKCFTFDSRANGYGRGDGIGVVVMKRLSDALRDNDTIHAVIRASSTNQDGRTTGITLPSKEAQVANIRSVYANAGLDFNQTAYVECHGTGTQAGDWRELRAISETLAAGRSVDNPIVVGSVKTNIGHLEGAAGIAGLIKGVLTLEHGRIPPNINFIKGNPTIDFESWKVKVPTEMLDWPIPGVRRVSVNCFGFGGSNAHVVMDEAPGYLSSRNLKGNHSSLDAPPATNGESETVGANGDNKNQTPELQLFCYSAHDKNGVGRVMDTHISPLEAKQEDCSADFLRDYAYTLGCRRSNLEWKGFVVADSATELLSKIRDFDQSSVNRSSLEKKPKLAFLFCGQGAQWAQMGKDLMSFHAFSESLEEASSFMKSELGSEFDLVEEIFKDADQSGISHPMISQPATTALQVALVYLLNSFGVLPKYVVGHSSGEIAAAYASGALSRQDAWKAAYYRGMAAATIPIRAPKLIGGMMVVGMSLEEVTKYLTAVSKSAQVACINSPRSITISGQADAIDFIANDLRQKSIFCRVLDVKVAYHSSHMKLVEDDYKDSLGEMATSKCHESVKMFSSVTGGRVTGTELDAAYWAKNLVSPVQYVAAIQSLMSLPAEERPDMIIELSPGAALRSPTSDILDSVANASNPTYYSTLDRKQSGPATLLKLVGELWSRGCPVDMKSVVSRGVVETPLKCLSNLPSYPWNHTKQYWHESHLSLANRFREYPRQDLIGAKTADSVPFEPRWRGFLRIPENPWIQDHQVQKTVVYPAAGMVSMVLEGAKQMANTAENLLGYELADMRIEKAMLIPNNAHGLEVALNIKSDPASIDENGKIGLQEFAIYSKPLDRPWERHTSGTLRFHYKVGDWEAGFRSHETRYEALNQSCTESLVPRQLYEHLDAVGMNYGSLFQNITEVRKSDNCCVSKVRIPDTKSKMPSKFEYPHLLHPATLDSMFQTLLAIEPLPMVPVFIKSLFVSANLGGAESGADFAGYATTNLTGIRDAEATIVMRQANTEQAYVVIDGLRLTGLSSPSPQEGGFLPNHRNLCTQVIWNADAAFASPTSFEEQVAVLAHKYPGLSVLQVGGGYQLTVATLRTLAPDQDETPRLARYTIFEADGDTASRALSSVKDTLLEPFVEKISDISNIQADYHLIVVCNDAGVDADSLKKNLKVGGVLLKQAGKTETKPNLEAEEVPSNGTNGSGNGVHESGNGLDEPSNGTDAPSNGTHETAKGHENLEGVELQNGDDHEPGVHFIDEGTNIVFESYGNRQIPTANGKSTNLIVLTPQESGAEVKAFIDAIKQLEEAGQLQFAVSFMSAEQVLENSTLVSAKLVISLLDFTGIQSRDSSVFHWEQNDFDAFHALQKYAKGILWITRGAHMSSKNPKGSPIIALARTLISEDPLKAIATLDLGIDSQLGAQSVVQNVLSVFDVTFGTKTDSGPREMEFAEEAGKLYIPRLVTVPSLNRLVEGDKFFGGFSEKTFAGYQSAHPKGLGLKLTIAKPGIDDGSLYFTEFEPRELKPDEVEIAFSEAPLSFLDLETVMGRTDDSTIGVDVKGQVKRVGSEVLDLSPGDDVVALVAGGAIQDVLHVKAQFVKRIDVNIVPSFLISAYYALFHIGRAGRGRRVLIHAGASAFGLVAVGLALAAGAEVFATVIGSENAQQREALEQHGLSKDHILGVESGSFVAALQAATDGKGVDVVYNPTLENIDSSFKCVRKCGSIVQFASKSPSPHATRTPPASMTIVNLDLRQLLEEDADFVGEMFDCAAQLIAGLSLEPALSAGLKKGFEINRLQDGLRHIQGAPYLGFASVVASPRDMGKVSVLNENVTKPLRESLDAEGTYVLAGGLGGLGRSISDLLVRNGVRHLAYLSRSGASSEAAKSFIKDLQRRGVDARAYAVDICDEAALGVIIKDTLSVEMPPVRGVFQCAAVIRDAVFDNMTFDDWNTAIKPKTVGSWNLMQAITAAGHDPFYIFLASSAGVIGNRGQANYAAGNCFEDSLARYLRQQGKHAVAVDLGPVLGAGMLAEDEGILDILRASGFYGIRHGDFIKVIEHSITGETVPGTPTPAQVTLGVGTGGIIQQNQPADPYWSRTALYSYLNLVDTPPPDLTVTAGPTSLDTKSMLACAADVEAASTIVCTGLSNMLAKAMNMLPEEVDVSRPPNAYGVDSLVAVGVRNWVLSNCNVQISVFEILSDSTIAEMSKAIAEKGGYGGDKKAEK